MVLRMLAVMLAGLVGLSGAFAAEPGASDWSVNETGRVRLIAATTATGSDSQLRLGLQFQLQPGWKMYWRTPGDAGYPPKIDWSGTDNAQGPVLSWPAPKRFELAGLQNFGYAGEVVLPVAMTMPRPGQPARIRAAVEYLACEKICVPMNAQVSLDLPAGTGQPSAAIHDLSRFAALVPGDGARHGIGIDKVTALGDTLFVTARANPGFQSPDLFVEPAELGAFGAPKVRLEQGGAVAVIELVAAPGSATGPLVGAGITVTLVDGLRSMEAERVIGAAETGLADNASLVAMLGIAVLGGLILNLMPCVLPVLSIKILGAIGHGGAERAHIRAAFLASAAGIVVSFLGLAGAAVALKLAGASVGWGIQFQQPVFLAVMVALLLAFAANLWGWFEIRLPSVLMNVGASGQPHHTLAGHFLSGAFATLLATPCSAPFLGTAIGFALARGPAEIMVIFAMLGIGMAAPYLLVAAWPEAARRLPRPGRWMLTVKKAMGVALAATALWLGGILATQTGWLAPTGEPGSGPAVRWEAFDETAIAAHVAAGRVVFVDVTADWCITCKVNKAAVLDRGEVAARLAGGTIVAMRADWTKPDQAIARYLASFGRYGIPFNAVYGPKAAAGIALPELLSDAEVLSALDRAR
ncbi:Thiol:disulfide interchange protein dsbD [Magnetospirillum sp. LM-5]|nr:Thiol:disulfide interchange protein dsbD [Magnetospirillum sp. LM-5]